MEKETDKAIDQMIDLTGCVLYRPRYLQWASLGQRRFII